jgi:hypothetical protein
VLQAKWTTAKDLNVGEKDRRFAENGIHHTRPNTPPPSVEDDVRVEPRHARLSCSLSLMTEKNLLFNASSSSDRENMVRCGDAVFHP